MASTCQMQIEVLDDRQSGPFALEVIGTPVLCLEAQGDANLGPFTATARITNRGAVPAMVSYRRGVSSAFQSVAYWPEGRRDARIAFNECCGDQQSGSIMQKTLAPGEALLVSSWTRHHTAIWSDMKPALNMIPVSPPQDYVVQFTLAFGYEAGGQTLPMSESFEILLRAVPTKAD